MSWFYRTLVRPVLFTHDPEEIHEFTLKTLGWASRRELLTETIAAFLQAPALPVELMGLRFPNPIGRCRVLRPTYQIEKFLLIQEILCTFHTGHAA